MTKKIITLLLCLSTTTFAFTPGHHHRRAELPQPDPNVLQAEAQKRLAQVLAVASPLSATSQAAASFANSIITDLLDAAHRLIGSRYRSGSSGPNAFDCSGFTSFVFSKLGIQLKRSSQEQHTQGQAVASIAELLPGDLVFFGRHGRRGTTINHVGIVTAVDAATGAFEFIHSSSSQGVRVDRYPDVAYWKKHFTGGRRIIGIEAAQK